MMAIMMMYHICINIRMIMAQVYRAMSGVMRWIISPIVWRVPRVVSMRAKVCDDHWARIINRLNNVVVTIDIWSTYDLHMIIGV